MCFLTKETLATSASEPVSGTSRTMLAPVVSPVKRKSDEMEGLPQANRSKIPVPTFLTSSCSKRNSCKRHWKHFFR